ncbi:pheromone processing endoprotease [Teratosphaeriaceae sp. CCFEE 6253]|nr:pheromone processing endoprotease [Teratosphaeriaceae sp. CCFEE 6253]
MRVSAWLSTLLAVPATCLARRDYDAHDYYAVHVHSSTHPQSLAEHLGLHYEGPLGELEDHFIFRADTRQHGHDHIQTAIEDLRRRRRKRDVDPTAPHILDRLLLSQKQDPRTRFPRLKRSVLPPRQDAPVDSLVQKQKDIASSLGINDPIFADQWHLYNPAQPGHDINVTGVWAQGITGTNSTVCIVDDGLDMDSDDLRANYFAAGSYDFNDHVDDPKPRLSDDHHGTRCAGEVAAVRNDVCGVGVAYDGKVSGARILSGSITDADEAIAMNYAYDQNYIFSCSWGPPDDGQSMEQPGILIRRAMVNGIQKGRGGLGSVYVFAIGNGAANDDNCNFDGYTNSIYSVSVGGIDRKGLHPYYSEKCAAQLVVTYSSGSGDAIHTTDVGKANCYTNHGGTSAAGPLVAGIYALAMQINPHLSWRDLQWLTVVTAVKVDQPSDWIVNQAMGKEFSHQYGYGKADAWALVEAAKNWTNVKPQAWFYSPWLHVQHPIPQGDKGLASSFTVTADALKTANLERIEHVTVTMNVAHTRRGDLSVELRSPSGMVSHIATHRRNDAARAGYADWTFMSVAHWGESGVGSWTVVVKDTNVNEHNGTFTDWKLKLWGECRDAGTQGLLPMPTEGDDDDHEGADRPVVGTTSVAVPTETGKPEGNPEGHQDRPVNSKHPAVTVTTAPAVPDKSATPTAIPTAGTGDEKVEQPDPSTTPTSSATPTPSSTAGAEHLLPHLFPTFGVTKATQRWIYGSITLILVFLVALGAYWIRMKRKRRWMNREEYGFEMVDHDDADAPGGEGGVNGAAGRGVNGGVNGVANGGANGGQGKKKAAQLYDAFAPDDSEGEESAFGLGSEEGSENDHGRAHDEVGRGTRYRDDEPLRPGAGVR